MRKRSLLAIGALLAAQAACADAVEPAGERRPAPPSSVSLAPAVVVDEGVYVPPQVKLGQSFQTGFSLRNTGSSAVTFEEIALAILKPDGSHLYDAVKRGSVTIAPGARWTVTTITSLFTSVPPGTYRAIARGRLPGGDWFDFGVQGGASPAYFNATTSPAFGAVIESININPSSVAPGQRPRITVTIRNTSTTDTQWGGDATFWIKATVRRNGVLLKHQSWHNAFNAGQMATSFDITPDYDASVSGTYDVTYQVYSGDNVYQFATRWATFWVEPAAVFCAPPPDALTKQSYLAFWRAPYGFKGATPWLQVVHDKRSTAPSTVEIDFIRLWARINSVTRVVAANEYDDGKFGGQLCARSPWGTPPSCHGMPGTVANGVLTIQPSTDTSGLWHPYLESYPDPRADISRADSVWTEVRLRITGAAMAQVGLDYWRDLGYPPDNRNAETGINDWTCTAGTWQTLRLARSVAVVDSIRFTTPTGVFAVGTPITGALTLVNGDNETVTLEEAGIEVRRLSNGDIYCDSISGIVPAFPWKVRNVTLARGATVPSTSAWTPDSAGTYCATVVEKRPGSLHRKVYLRPRFQLIQVN